MKKIEKNADKYIKEFDGFEEKMPFLSTNNISINVSSDGKILSDSTELMALDYINDGDITLNYELLRKMSMDLGPFHKSVKKFRQNLEKKITDYRKNNNNTIPAKVFFQNIKASLNLINDENFLKRLNNTKKLINYYQSTGQVGACDKAKTIMLGLNKEHIIKSNAINFFINREHVIKFIPYVKFKNETITYLKNIKDFPRIIPKEVLSILNDIKSKKIFDDFEILYLDYTSEKHETETKDSQIERDPVLFGTIKEFPNRLYFITYWDDNLCDLTMKEILEEMTINPDREEFGFLEDVKDVDEKYLKKIEKELSSFNSLENKSSDKKNNFISKLINSKNRLRIKADKIISKIKFKR